MNAWANFVQQAASAPVRRAVTQDSDARISRLQRYVLDALRDGRERTTNHISTAIKHPQGPTGKILYALHDMGLVTKEVRSGRSPRGGITNLAYWRIVK